MNCYKHRVFCISGVYLIISCMINVDLCHNCYKKDIFHLNFTSLSNSIQQITIVVLSNDNVENMKILVIAFHLFVFKSKKTENLSNY